MARNKAITSQRPSAAAYFASQRVGRPVIPTPVTKLTAAEISQILGVVTGFVLHAASKSSTVLGCCAASEGLPVRRSFPNPWRILWWRAPERYGDSRRGKRFAEAHGEPVDFCIRVQRLDCNVESGLCGSTLDGAKPRNGAENPSDRFLRSVPVTTEHRACAAITNMGYRSSTTECRDAPSCR